MTSSLTIEDVYVTDTHALLWYLTGDKKLGKQAKAIFLAAEQGQTTISASVIVLTELFQANKKWGWFPDFPTLYNLIRNKPSYSFVPLEADDVLDFDRDAAVPEMHDRIIAGLARRLGAPLLTADSLIAKAGIVRIVW